MREATLTGATASDQMTLRRSNLALVLRSLMQELAGRGKVVLFSSHELETVERVCSRVVILHRGKVVADDSIAHLRTLMALPTLEEIFSQLAVEQDTVALSRQIADLVQTRA